ncbi:MAG: endonuclease domain-containing protein [Armatimonas sp.]
MDNGYEEMRTRARRHRNQQTESEQRVWEAVRGKHCGGFRFRRQEVMGQYIADFYCPEERLVLEIDGASHDPQEQQDRDRWRDEALNERGLWVLRLRNAYVLNATSSQIRTVLLQRIEAHRQNPL